MVEKGEQCPNCGQYYDRHLVVNGVIIRDGKVLLIRRGNEPEKGLMALPGGYVDWDETVEEAMVREIEEETGIKTQIDYVLGIYSDPGREKNDKQNIAISFKLSVLDDTTVTLQPEEVFEIGWYDPNILPNDMAFDHRTVIRDYTQELKK